MFQDSPATAGDLARNLGVGGALFLISLWLILKYRPWYSGNGNGTSDIRVPQSLVLRIDALALKVVTLESKVDILWSFLLRRSISEGLAAGTLTRESPLKANVQILDRHQEVLEGIKVWYEAEAKQLTDLDLFVELERRFSIELHALCEREHMLDGACLAATLFILRPESPIFKQYDAETWHDAAG